MFDDRKTQKKLAELYKRPYEEVLSYLEYAADMRACYPVSLNGWVFMLGCTFDDYPREVFNSVFNDVLSHVPPSEAREWQVKQLWVPYPLTYYEKPMRQDAA